MKTLQYWVVYSKQADESLSLRLRPRTEGDVPRETRARTTYLNTTHTEGAWMRPVLDVDEEIPLNSSTYLKDSKDQISSTHFQFISTPEPSCVETHFLC